MPTLIASLLRKAALLVLMLLALSLAVFYISRLTPGDPLQSYYGDAVQSMSSAELDAARQRLGLDGPIWEQYQRWAGNVLDGDFGMSLKYKRPVVDVVLPLLGNTLLLGGLAYALVFVLAIALALLCARFEHSALDRLICRVGTTAYYVPAFCWACCWCWSSASIWNGCPAAAPTATARPATSPTAPAIWCCRWPSWWPATCGITPT